MLNKKITKRTDDYPQWYQDIVEAAELAEHGPVKGTMIIKPYGYAIWENIQKILDQKIKKTGHVNAYFPLLFPKSFLTKEAKHVDGFAKECAVVTHHRMKKKGKEIIVDESAKLNQELIIRPTSKEKLLVANYALEEGVERSDDIDQMIEELIHVYSEKVEVTEERIEEMYEEHYVSQVEEMGYEADIPLEDMREELEMGLVTEELESTFKSKAEEMKDSADIEVLVNKDYF